MYPLFDRGQHVVAVGAGLDPNLLQRQTFFVNHFQRLTVLQQRFNALVVTIVQQAGFTRQQALGTAELVTH